MQSQKRQIPLQNQEIGHHDEIFRDIKNLKHEKLLKSLDSLNNPK